jgi:hypothetical protein
MGITDTQSYALVIRDAFHDALAGDTFFTSYTVRKTKMLVARTEYLPYLGVYIIDETMNPDGDANAGVIRFSHVLRVGFSVMIANNDQVVAEQTIDAAFWRIMNRLWPDAGIMNVFQSSMPDNTQIEGVTHGLRKHVFGNAQLNNETPIAELQYDVSVSFRTFWPPIITDDLETIDITTGVKPGDTQDEMDQRQQAHVRYLFDISPRRSKR